MLQPADTGERSPLAPNECRVWWATIADGGPHLASLLHAHERERSRAYVRDEDRSRFEVGAALLRRAVAACRAVDGGELRVDRRCAHCGEQHGKPHLPDHRELDVSVAHSGELVAVALARGARVGVDVERIRDADVAELARTAFSGDEVDELAALPAAERVAAFYVLWTRKEAIGKALGTGIAGDFAGLSAATTGATMHELACAPGYAASLATLGGCVRVSSFDGGALLRAGAFV